MATLINWNYTGRGILTYDPMVGISESVNKLIDIAFNRAESKIAASRLQIRNGRYMYTPSNEYTQEKSRFIRFKAFK
jgi:hypothetical protein